MTDLTNPIFQNEDKARAYLEKLRWPDGAVCPHCGSVEAAKVHKKRRLPTKPVPKGKKHRPQRKGLYYCNDCKGQFTVQVGTVLERSRIPLNKWLAGFYLMCASKKGVSAHQMHRTLKLNYRSAWFMCHRIREAMRSGGLVAPTPMGSGGKQMVESDETYIGDNKRYKNFKVKKGYQHKHAVLTLVDREGEARSFHIDRTDAQSVLPIVERNLDREATLITDSGGHYRPLKKRGIKHETVNHHLGEYVRGDIYTNSVENYFSIFKRGMKGVYQHCSEKHLHRYLAEFDFRYSNRVKLGIDDGARMAKALQQIEGKRLTYRRTHGA